MKRTYLLAASCVPLMAAPSFASCSMADPNPNKGAGRPLVDCWIYPEDGGDGKIVKLEEGADAPEGFAFEPAPIAEVMAEDALEVDDDALTAANERIELLETEVKRLNEDVIAVGVEQLSEAEDERDAAIKQIAKLETEVKDLNAKLKAANAANKKLQKQTDADAKTIAELQKPVEPAPAKEAKPAEEE